MDELLRRIKDCKEQVIHINIRSDGIMAKVQNGFIKEKEEIYAYEMIYGNWAR